MAGGFLAAAAGIGLSYAGIMALKRRTSQEWLRENVLPLPATAAEKARAALVRGVGTKGVTGGGARVCIYQLGVEGDTAFAGVCNALEAQGYERHGVRDRAALQRALTQYDSYSRLVMAAHGDPSWFFAGFGGINAPWTARQLRGRIAPGAVISLAGCRAGADPGEPERWTGDVGAGGARGYSGQLRDLLVDAGAPTSAEIRAHTTTGHTTENPRARVFPFSRRGQPGNPVALAQGPEAERWILAMAGYDGSMGDNEAFYALGGLGALVLAAGAIGYAIYDFSKGAERNPYIEEDEEEDWYLEA
jgi:hypothetical protein